MVQKREREAMYTKLSKEKEEFIKTNLPTSRDDLNKMSYALMKLFMDTKTFKMSIDVLPPDTDSKKGQYLVTLVHANATASSAAVHLYDALYSARSKLYDLLNPPIETAIVEQTVPIVAKKPINPAEINFFG